MKVLKPTTKHQRLAWKVFKECWAEFYVWHQGFVTQQIRDLKKPQPVLARAPSESSSSEEVSYIYLSGDDEDSEEDALRDQDSEGALQQDTSVMRVWSFNGVDSLDGVVVPYQDTSGPTFSVTDDPILPYPSYESCAPINLSLNHTNSAADNHILDFDKTVDWLGDEIGPRERREILKQYEKEKPIPKWKWEDKKLGACNPNSKSPSFYVW